MKKTQQKLSYASWGLLAYTLMVILWGAFVRATGSGAGCGNHWPLCNGEIVPRPEAIETIIEFTHRAMTGLLLPLVVGFVIWVFRRTGPGHPARTGVTLSVAFLVIEALIGAGLVRFELVADNASVARAVSSALHLVNTYLLLAAMTLTSWWVQGGGRLSWSHRRWINLASVVAIAGWLALGASGAVTALGDTLFPADSISAGLRQDFSPTAHFLVRLRIVHPLLALVVAGFSVALVAAISLQRAGETQRPLPGLFIALITAQLFLGLLNVALLAPVWLQLVHLLVSDLIWISFLWYLAGLFEGEPSAVRQVTPAVQPDLPEAGIS